MAFPKRVTVFTPEGDDLIMVKLPAFISVLELLVNVSGLVIRMRSADTKEDR